MTVTHDRIEDFIILHTVRFAGQEVVHTVGRGGMDDTGTGIQRDVFFGVDRRETAVTFMCIVQWMSETDAFQCGTLGRRQYLPYIQAIAFLKQCLACFG